MLRRWISCVAGGAGTSTSGSFIPRQLLGAAQATCPGAAAHDPAAGAAHTRSTASARKHQNTAVDRPVAAVRAQLVASSAPRPPRVCTHGELSVRVRVVAAVQHHCTGAPLLRCRLIRSSDAPACRICTSVFQHGIRTCSRSRHGQGPPHARDLEFDASVWITRWAQVGHRDAARLPDIAIPVFRLGRPPSRRRPHDASAARANQGLVSGPRSS